MAPRSQRTGVEAAFEASHLPALDGLRAIAVFLVIFYHFGIPHVPGAHGVMIFFVLSGFLITWLLLKENELTGTISLKGFYKRRTLRIFPAFYVYWLLLIVALSVAGKTILWPHAWSAFFYLSNYYHALHGDPSNGLSHTWSLAIEEQFYLLWPLAFLLLRRNLPWAPAIVAGMIVAVWVYRAVLCFAIGVDQGYIYAAFDTRLDMLLVGCLTAILIRQRALPRFWHAVTAHPALPLATIALLLASIFLGGRYVHRYRDVFGFALEPPLIAILLVQLVVLARAPLWRWTEWRVVKFLGRISYSLYLYQQVILGPVKAALDGYSVLMQLFAGVLLTTLVAAGSYYLVERPFLKLKDLGKRNEAPVHEVGVP